MSKSAIDKHDLPLSLRARIAELERDALLLANVSDAIVVIDPVGVVTYWNDGAMRLFGWQSSERIGQPLMDCFPESSRPEYHHVVRAIFGGAELVGEYACTCKDGGEIWVHARIRAIADADGHPIAIIGLAKDITDRKEYQERLQRDADELTQRVEERTADPVAINAKLEHQIQERKRTARVLRESEERYRLLAEHATDMIARNSLEGVILYVSPAIRILMGYEPEDVIGRSAFDLVHPDDIQLVRDGYLRMLTFSGINTISVRARKADETYTWLETSARTFFDPQTGAPLEVITVTRDISDRKEAERLADELRADLAHVARLSTMGELSTGLAHELKQPLSTIVAYAEGAMRRLETGKVEPPVLSHVLKEVVIAAQRAGQIIRRMQDFVRKGTLTDTSPVHVALLVGEVLELLAPELHENGIALQNELSSELPEIIGDSIQIQQVILNIVRNAIESMRDNPRDQRTLTVRSQTHRGWIEVEFHDTGIGVSPENLKMLFTPFFTTKAHGLGVGLSISKTIIEAHRGRLSATRNPDRGMTFHFRLPFHAGQPQSVPPL